MLGTKTPEVVSCMFFTLDFQALPLYLRMYIAIGSSSDCIGRIDDLMITGPVFLTSSLYAGPTIHFQLSMTCDTG